MSINAFDCCSNAFAEEPECTRRLMQFVHIKTLSHFVFFFARNVTKGEVEWSRWKKAKGRRSGRAGCELANLNEEFEVKTDWAFLPKKFRLYNQTSSRLVPDSSARRREKAVALFTCLNSRCLYTFHGCEIVYGIELNRYSLVNRL